MSALFFPSELLSAHPEPTNVWVEGLHIPESLVVQSGVWVQGAASGVLSTGTYPLVPSKAWRCFIVEQGLIAVKSSEHIETITLVADEFIIFPPVDANSYLQIEVKKDARLLCLAMDGPLILPILSRLGLFFNKIVKQPTLPSQSYLVNQIVQVAVRHTGTGSASYKLQQLLWGLFACHSGQPTPLNSMLSYEIAKVVDTLQSSDYRENYSLSQMAAIAKMPVETFRKRFSNEIGMPPLSYLLFCKMEKAKELLRLHSSIKQASQAVGITDPYHFSKQFKNIVGVSPSVYVKYTQGKAPLPNK